MLCEEIWGIQMQAKTEQKNKPIRKTSIAIEKLDKIIDQMSYYYHGTSEWKKFLEDANYIKEHMLELSTEKKIDHARLAKKFKALFFKENKELKEINKELKVQVEELKHDIQTIESEKHE